MVSGDSAGLDVVVVAYGPPDVLAGALAALGQGYPTVVVDNSSSPATAAVVSAAGARYVDPGANLGFAAGVNVGLECLADPTRDVLLLNPDARITPDALDRLHHELQARPRVACVAPAQHTPGSAASARARWPWHTPAGAWAEAVGLTRRRLRSSRYFLAGSILLLRKTALAEVGTFDERYFLYSEDEDWQRRALACGWQVHFCPDVAAEHAAGGTESDRTRLQLRLHAAIERYIRKWYGPGGWVLYRAGTLFGQALRCAAYRGARRRSALRLLGLYLHGPDRSAQRAGAVPALRRLQP
ncbi:MAG TPA: glycosyltransferase family 2 protein [Acidimicrobiales bacterium]|nr:glycosyltransferase family 2 protein [Acidimicrobiales bacterium]